MPKRVTIRLIEGKEAIYDEFQTLVKEKLHSDVCYVTTSLMEAFVKAVEASPNADSKVTMEFLKQRIQINLGCTFQYYTKKARRVNNDDSSIISDTHNLLPTFIDQYPTMKQDSKAWWIEELRKQGFNVSKRKKRRYKQQKKKKRPYYCMTNVTEGVLKVLKGFKEWFLSV
jgi:hypothetical protein